MSLSSKTSEAAFTQTRGRKIQHCKTLKPVDTTTTIKQQQQIFFFFFLNPYPSLEGEKEN